MSRPMPADLNGTRWMPLVTLDLGTAGYKLDEFNVLEMFAGDGSRHVMDYAKRVKSVELWEVNPNLIADLGFKFPTATVRCVDSMKEALSPDHQARFDMVVVDAPLNLFGQDGALFTEDDSYCEHFEALPLALDMLEPSGGVVLFNVLHDPYEYDHQKAWQKRRQEFYGTWHTDSMPLGWLSMFYYRFFDNRGWEIKFNRMYCRTENFSGMVFGLRRRNV